MTGSFFAFSLVLSASCSMFWHGLTYHLGTSWIHCAYLRVMWYQGCFFFFLITDNPMKFGLLWIYFMSVVSILVACISGVSVDCTLLCFASAVKVVCMGSRLPLVWWWLVLRNKMSLRFLVPQNRTIVFVDTWMREKPTAVPGSLLVKKRFVIHSTSSREQ